MQLGRREFLGFLGLVVGCTGTSPATSRLGRPTNSETPDASRQTPGTTRAGAAGAGRPSTFETIAESPPPTDPATTTSVPVAVIEVIERAAWGALPATEGMVEHTIERLTVHHTGVELGDNREAPSRLRAHQVFHQEDRGWPDLAYHFAIDRAGNVYEGRSPEYRGDTATSYDPTGHFLVVLEGNFDDESVSAPQLSSLIDVLAWGAMEYEVSPEAIKGHRDFARTSCPGNAVYELIQSGVLLTEVSARGGGRVDLRILRGGEALERVNEIESGG